MPVFFFYDEDRFKLFDETIVKNWIVQVSSEEKKSIGEISYRFVSEPTILEINSQFLNHQYFTDIITFDDSLVNIINGEIVISLDTVLSNAHKFQASFKEEMHRVVIHGIMHLCGYPDSTESQKLIMREKENYYLAYLENL